MANSGQSETSVVEGLEERKAITWKNIKARVDGNSDFLFSWRLWLRRSSSNLGLLGGLALCVCAASQSKCGSIPSPECSFDEALPVRQDLSQFAWPPFHPLFASNPLHATRRLPVLFVHLILPLLLKTLFLSSLPIYFHPFDIVDQGSNIAWVRQDLYIWNQAKLARKATFLLPMLVICVGL